MKKFLLMIGLISIGLTAAAQPRFGYGIRAGMNLTDMVGKHSSITNDWRVGFAAGIFIDYRFTDAWKATYCILRKDFIKSNPKIFRKFRASKRI